MTLEEKCKFILDNKMKAISFYKEDKMWYADVPEHTKEENEMVYGADKFLEFLSGGKDRVTLEVADDIYPKPSFLLQQIHHDDAGSTYEILPYHHDAPGLGYCPQEAAGQKLWLCNVVHTVLGEHPKYISIISVR